MKRIVSIWLCFALVAASAFLLVDAQAEEKIIEISGSGSDLIISNLYSVAGLETWSNVTVTGTGKLIVPTGTIFNVTNIYLQSGSIIDVLGGTILLSNPLYAENVLFNGTCSYFNVTDGSIIQMQGSDGYADTSSLGPYTAFIPVSKGGDADMNITATEKLIIDNSTINLTGGNGFDLPKSAAFSSSAWCSGIILNGYVAAGGNATINLTLTNNDTSLTIDNSSLNAKGGDGGDAADGGNGAFGSRGRFGGYTDVNVTDFVGSGGLASVNCDAIIVQITNSTVNILGGNGGNAGDGGFTFDVNAGGGAGAGYSGGNGGSYNGGTGAKGGDVSGRVGAGGFAYLIINGKAVNIIAATLLAQGGNGGNAGNGGDGCYGFSNYGGPGGGGGGYSGGGGGGCKYGGGGSAGSVSEYVGSGGNAFLIINSDYLKVLDNSSLSSVGGNGGSSGIPGEDGFQDTTYTGGYGGKGDYSAMGGPGGGFLGWGPWGTSSLSGQVAYGGNAVFNLTVTNCSISRNTFTERTVGSGVSSGTKYVHIPMSIPIITSPANGSYSETPLALSWIPQYSSTTNGDIEKYNIQIAEDLDFNSIVLDTFINGADSSTYLPTTISGECYWRVSAFYLDSPYFGGWSETRQFTVYSFEPNIALISPSNNSVIFAGSILDFNISDANLNNVNVSINDGINTTFLPPYNISTLGWEDGTYNIEIYAYDDLNNEVVREFIIIVDSSCPVISLVSPLNNSIILRGTVIDIEINDDNLEQANYSLDGIIFQTFDFPYDLDTIDWADEAHTLVIQAIDQANNTAMESYTLTTYSIFPNVASTIPANNSINISVNAEIIIEFSESMNEQSVENAMSFEPIINVSGYSWSLDGKNLTINLLNNLSWNSSYIISVGEGAKDNAGNDLISAYYFSFTTILNSENDNSENDNSEDDNSEEDNSTIPSEIIDTDNDGIDDITDTDDDGDGYLDEWEVILGTNPLDATETPIDTDDDGIPDGDATNSLLWMDSDDDGDDVPDNIDLDPLDSDVGEVVDEPEDPVILDGGIENYLWIIIILIIAGTLGAIFMLARKRPKAIEEEPIVETEKCSKCGSEIEKGSICQSCAEEKPPEPAESSDSVTDSSESAEPEPKKPKFTNEEMLEKIEKSYKEGKLNEEQYLRNKLKFSK